VTKGPEFCGPFSILLVLPAGLADALQRRGRGALLGLAAEVAQAYHADDPVVGIHHRKAADLRIAHPLRDREDVIGIPSANHIGTHQIAD
jgi:hypothetical protein